MIVRADLTCTVMRNGSSGWKGQSSDLDMARQGPPLYAMMEAARNTQ